MTYFDVLAEGRAKLPGDEAALESQLLLSCVSGLSKSCLLASLSDVCPETVYTQFLVLIERRLSGYPIQWILGAVEFMGRKYRVSEGVLIPRSDTEVVVETAALLVADYDYVIECGCGSGIISIELALRFPGMPMMAWDIRPECVALASFNAELHEVSTVTWQLGDFFDAFLMIRLLARHHRILLVSNPPYIPTDDILGLSPTVREFEPRIALDGGQDGLTFYRRLVELAALFKCEFAFVFEIGIGQYEDVSQLMSQLPDVEIRSVKDLSGIDRVVQVTQKKRPLI